MKFDTETCNQTRQKEQKRKEGVGKRGTSLGTVFIPLGCVGEVFSCMAHYIFEIIAVSRVDDFNIE